MFARLVSWFRGKEPNNLYRSEERMIFRYFNGEREVLADPLELYKRLKEVEPELNADIKVANSPSMGAKEALTELVNKIRTIFNLKPLSDSIEVQGTLTGDEAIDLLTKFYVYCGDVKKNSSTFQTLSQPMEECNTSSENVPPISSSSDSGSTVNESSINEPIPSPLEQGLLSES